MPDRRRACRKGFCGSGGKGEEQQKEQRHGSGVSLAIYGACVGGAGCGDMSSQPSTAIRRSSAACRGRRFIISLRSVKMEVWDYESAMSHYDGGAFAGGQ